MSRECGCCSVYVLCFETQCPANADVAQSMHSASRPNVSRMRMLLRASICKHFASRPNVSRIRLLHMHACRIRMRLLLMHAETPARLKWHFFPRFTHAETLAQPICLYTLLKDVMPCEDKILSDAAAYCAAVFHSYTIPLKKV